MKTYGRTLLKIGAILINNCNGIIVRIVVSVRTKSLVARRSSSHNDEPRRTKPSTKTC